MKNRSIVYYLILIVIVFISSFFLGRMYRFYSLSDKENIFNTSDNTNSKFVSILDDKHYRLHDDKFESFESNGDKIFSIDAENVSDIIYDYNIHLFFKDGRVESINRRNGNLVRSTNLNSEIKKAEIINKYIVVYTKDSIKVLNKRLKLKNQIVGLENPVSYDIRKRGNNQSYIEYRNLITLLNSVLTIDKKGDKFEINATRETFIDIKFFNDNLIALSNKYIYLIKDQKIVNKKLIINLQSYDFNGESIAIVDAQNLYVYDKNLGEINSVSLNSDIIKMAYINNSIIMLSKDKFFVYQNENIRQENIREWISSYKSKNNFYIVFKNTIEKINLK